MYKSKPICPVCGKVFNPKNPIEHINQYHKNSSDRDLIKIRDERSKYYTQPFHGKKKIQPYFRILQSIQYHTTK